MREPGNRRLLIAEGDIVGYVRLDEALASNGTDRWYEMEREGQSRSGRWLTHACPLPWTNDIWSWLCEDHDEISEVNAPRLVSEMLREVDVQERIEQHWTALAERLLRQGDHGPGVAIVCEGPSRHVIGVLLSDEIAEPFRDHNQYLGWEVKNTEADWDKQLDWVDQKRLSDWSRLPSGEYVASCTWKNGRPPRHQAKKRGLLARLAGRR